MDEIKEAYVKDLLRTNKRADNREFLQYRPISLQRDICRIPKAAACANRGYQSACGSEVRRHGALQGPAERRRLPSHF